MLFFANIVTVKVNVKKGQEADFLEAFFDDTCIGRVNARLFVLLCQKVTLPRLRCRMRELLKVKL